ncbi:zinc-dependent peptidase [Verrucomicrobia bacterium]|nr:zinc-dependent peptidase [Verrucomicrobiota bacterium]MDA7627214.1 zinc-dependent peptidase [Verrucomicrobiota bacterium]MDB4717375.1 zinc-dependent peptidase [Verrucomicrobiota bacterium]
MIFTFLKRRRRKKILSQPFPTLYREVLQKKFPLFLKLPSEQQKVLEDLIQVFLAEKQFEGCKGFEVSDEIRVLVAAQACTLLIGNKQREFSKLKSILIYPKHYYSKSEQISDHGIVTVSEQTVLGQSWEQGLVSLSWESAKRGAANMKDGRNVVIHEFAHQLDQEDGHANGLPVLRSSCRYEAWKSVLGKEYGRLQNRVEKGKKTIMDAYGATNPAEFFAVASECFFEKPRQLKRHRPELYGELKTFYGQDPVVYHSI